MRAEYRQLSRYWHACLGFGVVLPPRGKPKERAQDAVAGSALQKFAHGHINRLKRTYEELLQLASHSTT